MREVTEFLEQNAEEVERNAVTDEQEGETSEQDAGTGKEGAVSGKEGAESGKEGPESGKEGPETGKEGPGTGKEDVEAKPVKRLPQGPWEDGWETEVVVPVVGPNSQGGKNTGLRSLFNVSAAWRLMSHVAPIPYYQDERVLPMSLMRKMHNEVGADKQIAGYVSLTSAVSL